LRLAQANVARSSFLTLEQVSANAQRVGADVVVFGTIKRRDRVGALDRDVLTCELQAYDVPGRRIATSTRWDVPSDDTSYRQAVDLAQTESSWAQDSRYAMPYGSAGLAAELQRISEDLAAGLSPHDRPDEARGLDLRRAARGRVVRAAARDVALGAGRVRGRGLAPRRRRAQQQHDVRRVELDRAGRRRVPEPPGRGSAADEPRHGLAGDSGGALRAELRRGAGGRAARAHARPRAAR
jgi:hypothetical protein